MLHKNVSHQWTFERIGGFDQVKLSTDADWQHLSELDTKLWAVLSCPTQQLSLEQKTLKRLDKDADGRIRVNELTLAIQFVCDALQQPSLLARRQAILPLDALRSDTELGQNLTALAVLLLDSSQDKTIITLEQVESAMTLFSQQPFNGDGVITRDAIHSEEILAAFEEVIHCVGSREDISGKQGIDSDLLDVFTAAVEDRLAWMALAEQSNVLVLGDQTLAAIQAFEAVEAKINDYFARCALVSFDAQAQAALNPSVPAPVAGAPLIIASLARV
jgi:Ca2+-binding EF-hand superfamily protein